MCKRKKKVLDGKSSALLNVPLYTSKKQKKKQKSSLYYRRVSLLIVQSLYELHNIYNTVTVCSRQ